MRRLVLGMVLLITL
ncbi:unnamed protein product, partial [Didymodactylos carnosus]